MNLAISALYGFAPNRRPSTEKLPDPGTPDSDASPASKSDKDSVTLGKRDASWVTDAIAVAQFAGSGFLYNSAAKDAASERERIPPLSNAPQVTLEDPFLIAPGWTTKPDKFNDMINHLTQDGQNGGRAVYIREGVAYSDQATTEATEINANDRVFVAVYDDVLSPPDVTGPQLKDTTDMIKQAVSPKVDVLGYSMGGIAVRKMLDNGDQTVDQVAFLGTPHTGTRFAGLADYIIRRDINFAMNMAGVNADHLPTMAWMKMVDPKDPQSNPQLSALNASAERQVSNTNEMISIGSSGLATITKPWGGTEGGDGLVQQSSLHLDGAETVVLPGRGNKQHGALPSDTDAFIEMAKFFDWQTAEETSASA